MMSTFKGVVRRTSVLVRASVAVTLVLAALAVPALAVLPAPKSPVPEIDPGSLASALALVAGGVMVLRGRIRR